MGFLAPDMLWFLLAIPVLVFVASYAQRQRKARLEAFAHRDTWSVLSPHVSTHRRFHKGLFLLLALGLSIVAAARPYWGTRERDLRRRGIDIVVALDVSRSMTAADLPPSRLETARNLVREVVRAFPGQRVALMPFAGDAFVQCPLTGDYGIFLTSLRKASPATIGTPGTDIALALETATKAFKRSSQGTRVLLLVTDGEDHSGRVDAAAKAAAEAGIAVYSIGIGSVEGALLRGERGAVLEDDGGVKVVSRLDAETLRMIATTTGGGAYTLEPGKRFDIGPMIGSLEALQKGELTASRRIVREERFQWPLAAALLLLMLEALLGERRPDRRSTQLPEGVAA